MAAPHRVLDLGRSAPCGGALRRTGSVARNLCATLAWLAALLLLAGIANAEPVLPELTGRVVDGAGLLSASDRAALDVELAAIEAKSTDQVVVVTVPSLQGYGIEEFGVALGRKWGIGQKGKDNGIIVLVAPKERKVRFEVGRGLEPLLPDGKAGTIIRQTVLPAFRRGDYAGGIRAAVADVRAVLEGDAAELDVRSKRPPPPIDYSGAIVFGIWLAIVVIIIYAQMRAARQAQRFDPKHRGRARDRRGGGDDGSSIIFLPGGSGSWGGGWGGSGDGGGGFSGGGGDFGGGGASGDW